MTHLTNFYTDQAADDKERTIKDILSFDSDALESVHDYIQWIFPLGEPSRFNSRAPILTAGDVVRFKMSPKMDDNLVKLFIMMLDFYGFTYKVDAQKKICILKSSDYATKKDNRVKLNNHNHLRISRILKSLTLVGRLDLANAFYNEIMKIVDDDPNNFSEETLYYWKLALIA